MRWRAGETAVRREVWHGNPWIATVVIVVADQPDLLATYLPEGAQFALADGHPLGPHPDPSWSPEAPPADWLEAAEL